MYIGNIFEHPVNIDLEQKLTIIIGENGSGKTKLLDLMNEYFLNNNKNALYLKEDLFILPNEVEEIKAMFALTKLTNQSFKKYCIDDDAIVRTYKYLSSGYINDGYSKILYYLYMFEKYSNNNDLILLIDQPENYISIIIQKHMISWFQSYINIKSIFIVTHSPSLIHDNFDCVHNVTDFVNIYRQKESDKYEN